MAFIVNQKMAEKVISTSLYIYPLIENYNGFCGGWSIQLLQDPKYALSMWDLFEQLQRENKFNSDHVTTEMKSFFRSVIHWQYQLDIADAATEDGDLDEDRGKGIRLLEKFFKLEPENCFVKDVNSRPFYDQENYRIRIYERKWEDIRCIVDQHPLLIATDLHFMAITKMKGSNNKYYLSETNRAGYLLDKWENIILPINEQIKESGGVVHLKYSNWEKFPVKPY